MAKVEETRGHCRSRRRFEYSKYLASRLKLRPVAAIREMAMAWRSYHAGKRWMMETQAEAYVVGSEGPHDTGCFGCPLFQTDHGAYCNHPNEDDSVKTDADSIPFNCPLRSAPLTIRLPDGV